MNKLIKFPMVTLRRRKWWERLLMLFPAYRKAQHARVRQVIDYLVKHPEEPCSIDGIYIPNGYGTHLDRQTQFNVP